MFSVKKKNGPPTRDNIYYIQLVLLQNIEAGRVDNFFFLTRSIFFHSSLRFSLSSSSSPIVTTFAPKKPSLAFEIFFSPRISFWTYPLADASYSWNWKKKNQVDGKTELTARSTTVPIDELTVIHAQPHITIGVFIGNRYYLYESYIDSDNIIVVTYRIGHDIIILP